MAEALRKSYDLTFKLKIIERAELVGNHAAAREASIDRRRIIEWRSKKKDISKMLSEDGAKENNRKRKRLDGGGRRVTV
jgi:hypothetical protein